MRQYHQATSAGHTMIGYAVAQITHTEMERERVKCYTALCKLDWIGHE